MTPDKFRDIRTIPLAIQCPTCGYLYMRERHTHESTTIPMRQYIVGSYGAIEESLDWRKRQENNRHVWNLRTLRQDN